MPVPVIDLFAGPGGLGEGFAALQEEDGGKPFFEIGLSIEKTEVAHRTLTLRAVYRRLRGSADISHYYRFIRGEIDEAVFRAVPAVAEAYRHASREARCLELGKSDENEIDADIRKALKGEKTWVLIGGPPCQAYSLAGRSRRIHDKDFYNDEKHFLYREYLRIIRVHKPAIFVMENVKGLLSSRHSCGASMFDMIIDDLSSRGTGVEYEIRSFVRHGNSDTLKPVDFVIHAERYGIPQGRHRVILLGVRKGLRFPVQGLLRPVIKEPTVREAIGDLPRIRSRLSKADSLEAWRSEVRASVFRARDEDSEIDHDVLDAMSHAAKGAVFVSAGSAFMPREYRRASGVTELDKWLHDPELGGICQHEARSHMASDLARYLFAASYAKCRGASPTLETYPSGLLPKHKSVLTSGSMPFNDRFRVQCADQPSTTVVAHIAKDGHYYIHYDPSQCRSLTVREAARLQTFPDNYFFMGNRTEQYTQVGNAVPPLLAHKLAVIVRDMLKSFLVQR